MNKSVYYYWDMQNQKVCVASHYYQIPNDALLINTIFQQIHIKIKGDSKPCTDFYAGIMEKETKKFRTHLLLMGITLNG